MRTAKLIVIVILSLLMFACSTTKEVSVKTEETTTIQPITLQVPPISGVIPNIPLTKPDTTNQQPYGTYEGSGIIATKDSTTGKVTKTKAKIAVTVRKSSTGKPIADVRVEAQQDPIQTEAKVTNSKVTTNANKTTEPFLITIWNDVKWWFLGLFLVSIASIVILKKFFPALIKTYLKI